MTSVNTNAAALTALRTLQQTNNAMDATQNRISTGFKIGEAKDNAAYWSISTTLKSDNKSLATVKDALGLGAATVDVAYEALNSTKDVLDEISAKLTSARQEGIDRSKLQQEITDLKNQLTSIAGGASFSGENWLSVDSTNNSTYSATKQVVASFSRSASGSISIGTINVDITDVKLFDANLNADGILDKKVELRNAAGGALGYGGATTGVAPDQTKIQTVTTVTPGAATGSQTAGYQQLGTFDLSGIHAGDTLGFNLAVDGAPARHVSFSTTGITDQTSFLNKVNTAITTAFGGTAPAVATIDAAGKVRITSNSVGGTSAIAVTGTAVTPGDGETTSVLGLTATATPAFGNNAPAIVTAGTYTTSAVTADDNDGLVFRFTYNGALYEAQALAGTGNSGYDASSGAAYQTSLQNAINGARRVQADGTLAAATLGSGQITVGAMTTSGTDPIQFRTVNPGSSQSLSVVSVTVRNNDNTAAEASGGLIAANAVSGSQTAATASIGTFSNTGLTPADKITIRVNVSNTIANLEISTEGMSAVGGNLAADRATFVNRLNAAIAGSGLNGMVTARDDGGVIKLDTTGTTPTTYITVSGITPTDGDGTPNSSKLGVEHAGAVTQNGGAGTPATAAKVQAANAFGAAIAFDSDDALTFTINVNGSGAKTVKLDRALLDSLPGGSLATAGQISSATEMVTAVTAALATAKDSNGVTSAVTGITVGETGGRLTFEASTPGAGTIVVTDAVGSSGGPTMSVSSIDLTAVSFTSLTTSQQKEAIEAYIRVVDAAAKDVTNAAAKLGSAAKRIDLQKEFAQTLMDTIDKGVGNLVDADMSEESTKLQALQVKQQLGVQALSIANQSAQQLLRLFQ